MVVKKLCIMRVNSHGGEDIFITFRHTHGTLERSALWIARAHIQDRAHARLTRSLNHRVAIRVILLAIYMRVRIYKHKKSRDEGGG
jgi:hypothetical protein